VNSKSSVLLSVSPFWIWPSNVCVTVTLPAKVVRAETVRLTLCCALWPSALVTPITTVPDAAAVNVPLIWPVCAFRLKPAGKPVADQTSGAAPPVAARVAE
jgi:hypothetical protein